MQIKESAENYLEAILMLRQRKEIVRGIDVANELSVSKPSVSVAMKAFRKDGYINVMKNGNIVLTEKGNAIAARMLERHHVIAQGLMLLGVDRETAYRDSCKIEHALSDISFEKLKEHLKHGNHLEKMHIPEGVK